MRTDIQARLDAITAQVDADKRAGGPYRVYIPRPGSARLWLHWSFATAGEAVARVDSFYPALRKRAVIRHEV